MKFYFCEKCGARLTEGDIAEGNARDKKLKGFYCRSCAAGVLTMETTPLSVSDARRLLSKGRAAAELAVPKTGGNVKFYFCEKCNKRLTEADIAKGEGKDKKRKGVFCKECAAGVLTMEFASITEQQARRIVRDAPPGAIPGPGSSVAALKRRRRKGSSRLRPAATRHTEGASQASRQSRRGSLLPIIIGLAAGGIASAVLVLFAFHGKPKQSPAKVSKKLGTPIEVAPKTAPVTKLHEQPENSKLVPPPSVPGKKKVQKESPKVPAPEPDRPTAAPKREPQAQPPPKPVRWPVPANVKVTSLDLGAGVKMELSLIPAGSAVIGSPADEPGRKVDEIQHRVTISKPFYMGRFEVTQAQYQQVMRRNPSRFKGSDLPVETVNWHNAAAFCKKLRSKLKKTIRLPTEAEWEYVCRAGSATPYHSGTTRADLERVAWLDTNAKRRTHPVGQKEPNAFGLHDMHGNVGEWCYDWFAPYSLKIMRDPKGPPWAQCRVIRGGSWNLGAAFCRSACRLHKKYVDPATRQSFYGFRVVMEADEAAVRAARRSFGPRQPQSKVSGGQSVERKDPVAEARAAKFQKTLEAFEAAVGVAFFQGAQAIPEIVGHSTGEIYGVAVQCTHWKQTAATRTAILFIASRNHHLFP